MLLVITMTFEIDNDNDIEIDNAPLNAVCQRLIYFVDIPQIVNSRFLQQKSLCTERSWCLQFTLHVVIKIGGKDPSPDQFIENVDGPSHTVLIKADISYAPFVGCKEIYITTHQARRHISLISGMFINHGLRFCAIFFTSLPLATQCHKSQTPLKYCYVR